MARVGVRLEPGLIVEQLLDPGAVIAQVSLSSLGESTAFASNPFPGEFVGQLPSLVDSLSAGATDLPGDPFRASSSHPATPEARTQVGPMSLQAESYESNTRAEVSDGANRTIASASTESGDVVARAETTVGSLSLGGGVLQLSGVRSAAETRRRPSGEVERETDFSVARLSVLGQGFAVKGGGVELLGSPSPLGVDAVTVLDPLLAALREQGIDMQLISSTENEDGVVSGGVEISYPVDAPSVGTVTATLTIGRTYASVTNRARGPLRPGGPVAPGMLPTAPVGSLLPSPGSAPPAGASSGAGPAAVGPMATPTDAEASPLGMANVSVVDRTRVSFLFPVLFVVAAALMLGSALFRHLGVRLAWTS